MKNLKWLPVLVLISFFIHAAYAQIPKGEMAGTEVIKFKSAINNQDYILYIKPPASYSDTTKRYPVMYALDGQWSFPLLMEIRGGLLFDNLIPEMIFVGIAWPDNYFVNRGRDFTPTYVKEDSTTGGGPKFLEVLKNEIIKLVDSAYRTDKKNNGLLGSSLGGLFVLYTLFQQPSLFNRLIANSPSLFYDNEVTSKFEKTFSEKNSTLNAKLFISSGGYEEEADPVTFKKFSDQLKARKYKGLEIESLVVDKMGHGSAGPYAIGRGLQFVFSKPDISVDTLLLEQYKGHYSFGTDSASVIRTGNSIYLLMQGLKLKLNAETDKNFYTQGSPGSLQFKKNNNKVTGYDLFFSDKPLFYKKLD